MKRISVGIATYNRADVLAEVLQSVCKQDLPPDSFDVLVVDNASTDNTRQVVESFKDAPIKIRYVLESRSGASFARNRVWEESDAPLIAYLDDDAIAEPNWLSSLLDLYDSISPIPAGVGGRIRLRWSAEPPEWINEPLASWMYAQLDWGDQVLPAKIGKTPFGPNMSFRADILKKYKGFDTRLGPAGKSFVMYDETEFQTRLLNAGETIYYQPGAIVWHIVSKSKQTKDYVLRRAGHTGQSNAFMRVFERWPGRYEIANVMVREVIYILLRKNLVWRRLMSWNDTQPERFWIQVQLASFRAYERQMARYLLFGPASVGKA